MHLEDKLASGDERQTGVRRQSSDAGSGRPQYARVAVHARATETSANLDSNVAEAKGDAAKAALKDLDDEIDRVDRMIDNAPTPADKAAAKARMDVLKDRRSELRKTYVKARYDELKEGLDTLYEHWEEALEFNS